MTCRSIQRFCEAHHTPGPDPLVANLVISQIDVRDGRVYLQCLGQGLEAATDQGWRLVRGPFGLKCSEKGHSTETCRISPIQNLEKQSRNPQFHSASTYSMTMYDIQLDWEYLTTQLDPRLTMKLQYNYSTCKPSKLLTVTGFRKHYIMTCRSIQRFCGASHTPGLGPLGANLVVVQIDVRDGPVYFQCLGQGLEAATDQGWRLVRGPFGQTLISEMLRKKDIQLRHVESLRFKTWKNNPEIHSFIQHLHTV